MEIASGVKPTKREIAACARSLGKEFGAVKVVLFGSFLKGNASDDSDVDLLEIVQFKGRSVEQAARMRAKFRPAFSVDIIARTPRQIESRLTLGDPFIRDILDQGTVLYDVPAPKPGMI